MDLISILIVLLVVGVVVYFAFWMVDASGIPSPFNWVVKAIILLFGLVWLFGGHGTFPTINL